MSSTYTAKDITVLEGLEPVRKRPGMYIGGVGTAGLHHLAWEVLDNAIDEAMNGHASNIAVTLHAEGTSLTVTDDGRGIPVDKHPKTGKSALEVIFTVLHAGGKFEQGNYKTAGGLHGVGASVVNALSKDLVATVKRDGMQWEQRFRQGVPQGPIKKVGPARGTGTTVFFHPDPTIFPKIEFDAALIQERLEVASYIHRGLKITFLDEASGARTQYFARERAARLSEEAGRRSAARGAVHDTGFVLARDNDFRIDLALQWTESTDEHVKSYVNGIPTGSGGTHENGLRAGIGKAIRNFIDTHNLSPKGVTLSADDIREGLVAILSVFVQEPQFQGQTKDRLNNPEMLAAVDAAVRPGLEHWLNHNSSIAEAIVARIILAARAREASRAAQQEVVRKSATSARLTLPGKLSDCTQNGTDRHRDLHRRRRFGRRLGQAGPRPQEPGDPSAARQGAERRERVDGEGAREQGALRPRHRARLRHRQELRPGAAALRAHHHPGRRRFGRASHRDAAPDVHLPPHAAADRSAATSSSPSRRSIASTSARRRIGRWTMRSGMRSCAPACTGGRSRTSRGSRAWAR